MKHVTLFVVALAIAAMLPSNPPLHVMKTSLPAGDRQTRLMAPPIQHPKTVAGSSAQAKKMMWLR